MSAFPRRKGSRQVWRHSPGGSRGTSAPKASGKVSVSRWTLEGFFFPPQGEPVYISPRWCSTAHGHASPRGDPHLGVRILRLGRPPIFLSHGKQVGPASSTACWQPAQGSVCPEDGPTAATEERRVPINSPLCPESMLLASDSLIKAQGESSPQGPNE